MSNDVIGLRTVDWRRALVRLHAATGYSWRRLSIELGVGEGHLSRARRGNLTPGAVLAGRVVAMALDHEVLAEVFNESTMKGDRPGTRLNIALPVSSAAREKPRES